MPGGGAAAARGGARGGDSHTSRLQFRDGRWKTRHTSCILVYLLIRRGRDGGGDGDSGAAEALAEAEDLARSVVEKTHRDETLDRVRGGPDPETHRLEDLSILSDVLACKGRYDEARLLVRECLRATSRLRHVDLRSQLAYILVQHARQLQQQHARQLQQFAMAEAGGGTDEADEVAAPRVTDAARQTELQLTPSARGDRLF